MIFSTCKYSVRMRFNENVCCFWSYEKYRTIIVVTAENQQKDTTYRLIESEGESDKKTSIKLIEYVWWNRFSFDVFFFSDNIMSKLLLLWKSFFSIWIPRAHLIYKTFIVWPFNMEQCDKGTLCHFSFLILAVWSFLPF